MQLADIEQPIIKFINEKNKVKYLKMVLSWLKYDYDKTGYPESHFWHNRSTIVDSFDDCDAMVVLNSQKEIIGYMIWRIFGIRAEINIIEVKKDYRRQGICRKMLHAFCNKFEDISVLTASVLQQAEEAFRKLEWSKNSTKHIKIVGPVLQPLDALPNGRVIAICSQLDSDDYLDFYRVQAEPIKYRHLMKYFKIDIDEHKKLRTPIVTTFHYEGYIGIYFNKKLIAEGKAKHLFENSTYTSSYGLNLLAISRIEPYNPELFTKSGFFSLPPKQAQSKFFTSAHPKLLKGRDSTIVKQPKRKINPVLDKKVDKRLKHADEPKENHREGDDDDHESPSL